MAENFDMPPHKQKPHDVTDAPPNTPAVSPLAQEAQSSSQALKEINASKQSATDALVAKG